MKKQSLPRRAFVKGAHAVFALFPENHLLSVSEYRVSSGKIPPAFDGYRILQLSDLHSACFGKNNARLMKKVLEAQPDLVVLTGDMITRTDTDYEVFFSLARALAKKYTVYYVIGNHEQDMEPAALKAYLRRVKNLGLHVLDNEKVQLCRGDDCVDLYGMWFSLKYYKEAKHITRHERFGRREMRRIMGNCDASRFGILLTHDPLCFEVYAGWGADLTLCGHVHGGMIRLPFAGGLLSPEREFFPKYSGGVYEIGEQRMIVSRGLGSGVFGARINNLPELVVITLRAGPTDR
jgi:Predicted phosphohydrolases